MGPGGSGKSTLLHTTQAILASQLESGRKKERERERLI